MIPTTEQPNPPPSNLIDLVWPRIPVFLSPLSTPQPPTPPHTRTHYKQCHTHWDILTTPQTHTRARSVRLHLSQKSDVTHETLHRRAWTLFMGCQIRCAVVTETTCLSGLPAIWTYVILLVNDNQYKWLYLKSTQMKQWRYIWILLPLTTTRILRPFSQCYPGKRC